MSWLSYFSREATIYSDTYIFYDNEKMHVQFHGNRIEMKKDTELFVDIPIS